MASIPATPSLAACPCFFARPSSPNDTAPSDLTSDVIRQQGRKLRHFAFRADYIYKSFLATQDLVIEARIRNPSGRFHGMLRIRREAYKLYYLTKDLARTRRTLEDMYQVSQLTAGATTTEAQPESEHDTKDDARNDQNAGVDADVHVAAGSKHLHPTKKLFKLLSRFISSITERLKKKTGKNSPGKKTATGTEAQNKNGPEAKSDTVTDADAADADAVPCPLHTAEPDTATDAKSTDLRPPGTFHFFSEMPLELQSMVWEAASQPPNCRLFFSHFDCDRGRNAHLPAADVMVDKAIWQVCKESRKSVARVYRQTQESMASRPRANYCIDFQGSRDHVFQYWTCFIAEYNQGAAFLEQRLLDFMKMVDGVLPEVDEWYRTFNENARSHLPRKMENFIRQRNPPWSLGHENLELHRLEEVYTSLRRRGLF